MRTWFTEYLASELALLHGDTLVETWRTQKEISAPIDEEEKRLHMQIASENKLAIALKMHKKLNEITSVSSIWAKGLRDVLGEIFLTEAQVREKHKNQFDEMAGTVTAVRKRVEDELDSLGKSRAPAPPATDDEMKEKMNELKEARKGTF